MALPTGPDGPTDPAADVAAGDVHIRRLGGLVGRPVAVVTEPGEWVRYSTPGAEGAEYIAICLPAFSYETVRRTGETRKPY